MLPLKNESDLVKFSGQVRDLAAVDGRRVVEDGFPGKQPRRRRHVDDVTIKAIEVCRHEVQNPGLEG